MNSREDFSVLLNNLKPLVKNLSGDNPNFEINWESAVKEYFLWQSNLPAPISSLTRNLFFLETLWLTFKNDALRWDIQIRDLILEGSLDAGQTFKRTNNAGKEVTYRVIDRSITVDFGIQYILADDQGKLITEIFYE